MFYKIFSENVKINSLIKESIKSGDIINVNVIKQLSHGKWAIGIKGNVFPAVSEISLTPGQNVRAQIFFSDTGLLLKIIDQQIVPLDQFLKKQGLVQDALSEVIVMSLLKSDLKIDSNAISKLRKILEKFKRYDQKASRLLTNIMDKSINLSDIKIEDLFDMLEYGNRHDKKKYKRETLCDGTEDIKSSLKKILQKTNPEKNNFLQLFNHLKGNNRNWIILPFGFSDGESNFDGTVRLLYNDNAKKIEQAVLIVNILDNMRFSFYIQPKQKNFIIKIFCNDSNYAKKAEKKIPELNIKLQNKGIKVDDIIYNDEDFDGFTPSIESFQYKNIDTLM